MSGASNINLPVWWHMPDYLCDTYLITCVTPAWLPVLRPVHGFLVLGANTLSIFNRYYTISSCSVQNKIYPTFKLDVASTQRNDVREVWVDSWTLQCGKVESIEEKYIANEVWVSILRPRVESVSKSKSESSNIRVQIELCFCNTTVTYFSFF